jgi:conjugal transfer pilin signal peptidase TrbI
MKLVVKKQAWKVYLPKLASVGLFILLGGGAFMSRYRIGIDSQIDRCIPNYSVYLIDLKNQNIEKDKIYAFKANGLQPLLRMELGW